MTGNSFRRSDSKTSAVADQFQRVLQVGQGLTRAESPSSMPLALLHPNPKQPRRHFAPGALEDLAASIRDQGVLQPLLVRPSGQRGTFEIVCGERRWRAATMAGLPEVPVLIRELTDAEASAAELVENLQREPLDPLETVDGIIRAIALTTGLNVEDVPDWLRTLRNHPEEHPDDVLAVEALLAKTRGGKLSSFVVNKLPLLNLPGAIADAVRTGKLEYTKARKIAAAPAEHHEHLTRECVQQQWSVEQLAKHIAALTPKQRPEDVDRLRKVLNPRRMSALSRTDRQRAEKLMRELIDILGKTNASE